MMAGLSLWTIPAMFAAPISAQDRLKIWGEIYNRARPTSMLTFLPSALLFGIASYAVEPLPLEFAVLALCSTLTASVIGFTFAIMLPTIKALKAEENRLDRGQPATESSDDLIRTKWIPGHHIRVAIAASGFVLAVSELAFS
ncbi:hypothetical protein JCM10212_000680 [Sporobolomyces blumeae]